VRKQLHTVAEAFVADLNRITTDEFTQWRTDFVTSLAEVDEAAKSGWKTSEAGIADANIKAEKALKAAEDASRPATLNFNDRW
jgi:hypothetical protein